MASTSTRRPARSAATDRDRSAGQGVDTGTYQQYELLADLPTLIAQDRQLTATIKAADAAEAARKELRLTIEGLVIASGLAAPDLAPDAEQGASGPVVTVGPWAVRQTRAVGAKYLDVDKLLAAGVPAEVIAECYSRGEGHTRVDIRPAKTGEMLAAVDDSDDVSATAEAAGVKILTA